MLVYVGLENGHIVLKDMRSTTKASAKERTFKANDIEGIAKFLEPFGTKPYITGSSSCNHPEEYGFKASFDVNKVLQKAITRVREKLAIRIKPQQLTKTINALEKAAKGAEYPRLIVFEKTHHRTGEDVTHGFNEEDEFVQFMNGMRYARRLVRMHAKKKR